MPYKSATAIFGLLVSLAGLARGATYSLSVDFSNVNNPNGAWSFLQGTTPLSHFTPSTVNALNPVVLNGYWGSGSDLNINTPDVIKVTGDGSTAPLFTNNDFLAGDVIIHSVNPGTGAHVFIDWTAPSAGTISFSSSVWYAHSLVNRSNNVLVTLGEMSEGAGVVDNTHDRSNPITFSGAGIAVTAGEVLAVEFMPSAGQKFGSLDGLSETVTFTAATAPVPEPSEWAMIVGGLALISRVSKRRNRAGARS